MKNGNKPNLNPIQYIHYSSVMLPFSFSLHEKSVHASCSLFPVPPVLTTSSNDFNMV